ncbi:MAG: HEAT repeat domain-containing protein [Gemmataceae bacterium]
MPRICPECRTNLYSTPVRNGKLRCPECGALLSVRRSDGRIQAASAVSRALVKPPKSSAWPLVLILVGLGVGLFVLFVVGVGLLGFLYFGQTTPAAPVAIVTPDAQGEVLPVAPLNPQAEKELIPAAPPPEVNAGPPREPIQPAAGPHGAAGGNETLPLKELKAATVYIKVQTATMSGSGSGFVVHAQGNLVFVVTNHHVISPPKEDGNTESQQPVPGPQRPIIPIGPPRIPGMPIGPRRVPFPRRMAMEGSPGGPVAELTVVFYSGAPQEQALPATVVADDAVNDLAILRVVGVQETPRPIDYQRTPQLHELMPVVAFGFPFGKLLDLKMKNPAATVTKGNISSLRGEGDGVEKIQLDLDVNPGNSGGPVVDERGVLIGVVKSKIVTTRIGFAIPVPKLSRLLQGHIDPPTLLESLSIGGRQQVRVRASASDPFGKLRSPTLLYGLVNEVLMPRKGRDGWKPLSGGKSAAFTIQGTEAIATLALIPPANSGFQIVAQVSYKSATGQTIHGEPRILSLNMATPPPVVAGGGKPENPAHPPAKAPRPERTPRGEELTKLLAELKSPDETVRQRAASVIQQAPPRQRRAEVRRGLQELLTAADPATRAAGVLALAAFDPKDAAPSLAKLFADDSPAVRQVVARSLQELKDPRVAEAAAARLPVEPLSVLQMLKAMGPAAEKAVLPYLADKHAGGTRFWAFDIIKEIGTAASLPALEAVQGPEALHARGARDAIRGRLPLTADELPQALEDLKSSDAAKRLRACGRLAATTPHAERRAEVVARLEWLLNDLSGEVRSAAIKGIGRWGGPSAVPLLAKRLEDFNPHLHGIVMEVLAEMNTGEAAAAIAKRLLDFHDRRKALMVLKAMNAKIAEKAVLPLLDTTDHGLRIEIIKVLAEVGGRESITPLEKLAKDSHFTEAARQALESIEDRCEGEQ